MKLKKIASLALAGIMAVSMLAGCKDGGNGNSGSSSENTNTSGNFTSTVLGKSSELARDMLTVSDDTNIDKAVAYIANNTLFDAYSDILKDVGTDVWQDAQNILKSSDYTRFETKDDFSGNLNDTDATYAGLFIVSRERSDEWIAGNLANYVDKYVQNVSDEENCNMSIRIVTADGKYDGDVKKNGECVVIGILVDFDFTKDNH